jgi:hypothetical protein
MTYEMPPARMSNLSTLGQEFLYPVLSNIVHPRFDDGIHHLRPEGFCDSHDRHSLSDPPGSLEGRVDPLAHP